MQEELICRRSGGRRRLDYETRLQRDAGEQDGSFGCVGQDVLSRARFTGVYRCLEAPPEKVERGVFGTLQLLPEVQINCVCVCARRQAPVWPRRRRNLKFS